MTETSLPRIRWHMAHCFTSYSRQRGSEMVREGCAVIALGGDPTVVAHVRDGPSRFVVVLTAIRRELHVRCSCAVFELGRDGCRHVWAALVLVDRGGHLARVRRSTPELALVGARRTAS